MKTMKAIRIHQYGGPEVLTSEQIPLPEPANGEVRVRIEAVGVNYIDIAHRTGHHPLPLPLTLGIEAAGAIDAIGPGVSEVRLGDRVAYAMHQGSYAECAVVPQNKLVPVPADLNTKLAAAALAQGATAHYLSQSAYPLRSGDTALVHAAAGGVGLLLVQMAKRRGARVIGTVSIPGKCDAARQAGAEQVLVYTRDDFEAEVMRVTNGKGVNVVYDSIGQATFAKSLNCLAPRGYLILYGLSSGPVPLLDVQVLQDKGSVFLTRPSLKHYFLANRAELLERANAVFASIVDGTLRIWIDRTMSLAEAAEAHRCFESRTRVGKLLLVP